MTQIPLNNGDFAIVDDEDAPLVSPHQWRPYRKAGQTAIWPITVLSRRPTRITQSMGRLLLGFSPRDGQYVGYRNGDPLDNRRSNLLIKTKTQVVVGGPKYTKECYSKYKGVSRRNDVDKWCAYIFVDGRLRSLGHYRDEDDAARAYNDAALREWGEFARLNVIDSQKGDRCFAS